MDRVGRRLVPPLPGRVGLRRAAAGDGVADPIDTEGAAGGTSRMYVRTVCKTECLSLSCGADRCGGHLASRTECRGGQHAGNPVQTGVVGALRRIVVGRFCRFGEQDGNVIGGVEDCGGRFGHACRKFGQHGGEQHENPEAHRARMSARIFQGDDLWDKYRKFSTNPRIGPAPFVSPL